MHIRPLFYFFSLPGECKEALHLTPSVWVRLPWFQPLKPRSVYLQCLTMQKRGVKRPLWGFPVNQRWKYTDGGVKLFKCPALNVKWSLKLRKRLRQAYFFTDFFFVTCKWIFPILEFRGKILEFRVKILSFERKKGEKLSVFTYFFWKLPDFWV